MDGQQFAKKQPTCQLLSIHMYDWSIVDCDVKAILQVWLYKALYD